MAVKFIGSTRPFSGVQQHFSHDAPPFPIENPFLIGQRAKTQRLVNETQAEPRVKLGGKKKKKRNYVLAAVSNKDLVRVSRDDMDPTD
jgi:hypothetical protein